MADNNTFDSLFTGNNQSNNNDENQRSQRRAERVSKSVNDGNDYTRILSGIDSKLDDFAREFKDFSQSYAHDSAHDRRTNANWRNAGQAYRNKSNNDPFDDIFGMSRFTKDVKDKVKDGQKDFLDGIDEVLDEALGFNKTKDILNQSMNSFAKKLGKNVEDVPYELGKQLSNEAVQIFSNLPISSAVSKRIQDSRDRWMLSSSKYFDELADTIKSSGEFADIRNNKKQVEDTYESKLKGLKELYGDTSDAYYEQVAKLNSERSKKLDELKVAATKALDDYKSKFTYIDDDLSKKFDDLQGKIDKADFNFQLPEKADSSVFDRARNSDIDEIKSLFSDISGTIKNSDTAKIFRESKLGSVAQKVNESKFGEGASKVNDFVKDKLSSGAAKFTKATGIADTIKDKAIGKLSETAVGKAGIGLLEKFMPRIAGSLTKGSLSAMLGSAGGPLGIVSSLAIEAITSVINATIGKNLVDVGEKFDSLLKSMSKAMNRAAESSRKRTELGNKRLQEDLETIVKAPFKILEAAAQKVYDAWDNNLRIVNQTQGYSKSDFQGLMAAYVNRLKAEGLTSEIDAASLMTNLSNVLKSGLQGKVAEEFAYEATKLDAAIPTQEFFNYSNAYASLAANAIKDGRSQSEAIEYANSQLELFASDVAYASRQLTGGFATGLQDASDLFSKAVNISVAARTNNPSQIAGTLTSISAITGAIAPDLTNAIVDAVYNAATGGNNSQLVALRSLAGINASNTEFLRAFAQNPQQVFNDLFDKLADMQHMSEDNYMEVAEGLSNIFGLSTEAMSRVDFSYLADAVKNMQVNTESLQQNLAQLASGNSTTSSDQMRMEQINEYIVDNGLSYVLDNVAAREVQQHMWDEQIAQQLKENEYSVNLRGDSLSFLNSIHNLIQSIVGFLNPFSSYNPLTSLIQTTIEAATADSRVTAVLEAGKIGDGNEKVLHNLTTYGQKLNITNSYLSMIQKAVSTSSVNYTWGTLSKSKYASLGTQAHGAYLSAGTNAPGSDYSKIINTQRLQSNFNRMVDSMSNYFNSTVSKKVDNAISKETDRLAQAYVNSVSDSKVNAKVNEYIANPEKYGIGNIIYQSRLSNASKASGLSNFNEEVKDRSRKLVEEKVREDMLAEAKQNASAQAYQNVMKQADAGKYGSTGYEAWAASASKFGISDLKSTMDELGYDQADVQNYFNDLNTQLAQREAVERNQREETFWSETQRLLELANTNIYDVFDKGDVMGIFWPGVDSWLSDIDSQGTSGGTIAGGTGFRGEMNEWFHKTDDDINSFHTEMIVQFKEFRKDWTDFYINHTTYNKHLTGSTDGASLLKQLNDVKRQKDKSTEDVVNTLSEALMNNPISDLLDPTVQTNVFLASILQGVQTIIQQNNTQGKLKLPDAIAALATGMTVSTNAKTDA